jgi:radical SAM superfamily enzyme YgiQ (UPF0313 family)
MKILLLTPPYVPGFMRNARWDGITISGSDWYPIWLGYCTGLLEREGHEPKLVDAQVDRLTHDQTYEIARKFSPQLTVLYHSSKSLENDIAVGERIRHETGAHVVLVGPSASINPVETLEASKISLLARGEFDFTVLDLANGVSYDRIDGLIWKDTEGIIHVNPPRNPVPAHELDTYPFVTDVYRRHLNISNYHQAMHYHPFVDLFTGRGCAWGLCTFCVWPNTISKGAAYRTRKVENVVEELRFIKQQMPRVKEVYFQDDTMPKERALEISDALTENNLKIRWSCYSRANLSLQTLKAMKRAGCYLLEVGFESSSPEILRNIRKGTTVQGMEEFAKNAREAGISVIGAFIIGLPGETVQTVKATTQWAKKLPILRYTITLPKAYPGTPLYDWLRENDYLSNGKCNYPHLSSEEIYRWNKWSLKSVYFSREYLLRLLKNPRDWRWVGRSLKYFLPYLLDKERRSSKDLEW